LPKPGFEINTVRRSLDDLERAESGYGDQRCKIARILP
jgi:hypothetical protein